MKQPHSDIAVQRREQIIEAAVSVIVEQGLPNLSLSEIENKADMSRGQLTYYFPTKEDILLAVFDRMLLMTYKRMGAPPGMEQGEDGCLVGPGSAWEIIQHLFRALVLPVPSNNQEFHALQHTFLSQVGHREDFRQRLATLYEEWRSKMAEGLAKEQEDGRMKRRVSPRAMASLIQAMLHGLAMEAAADPQAFDREEMLALCLDLLGNYLGVTTGASDQGKASRPPTHANPALDARPTLARPATRR